MNDEVEVKHRHGIFPVLTGIPFFNLHQDHFSACFFFYSKGFFPKKYDFPAIFSRVNPMSG